MGARHEGVAHIRPPSGRSGVEGAAPLPVVNTGRVALGGQAAVGAVVVDDQTRPGGSRIASTGGRPLQVRPGHVLTRSGHKASLGIGKPRPSKPGRSVKGHQPTNTLMIAATAAATADTADTGSAYLHASRARRRVS